MEIRKLLKRAGAAALAGTILTASAATAFAESSANGSSNSTAVNDALAASDIIDGAKTGSLSIYKYDMTAAAQAGAFTMGDVTATGMADSALQETLYDYAVEGVEFTYLKVGETEQFSQTIGTGSTFLLVYELPAGLASILGLGETDAVDMAVDGISGGAYCGTEGVYHYTSDVIDGALASILAEDDVDAKNRLEAYVTDNGGTAMDLTDEEGYTYADGLELGLYLIVETKAPENITDTTDPWFVSLPSTNLMADEDHEYDADNDGGDYWFYDITCYPKNQSGNPTLDKLVRNATGEAADAAGETGDYSYLVYNADETVEASGSDAQYAAARGDAQYATTKAGLDAGDNDGTAAEAGTTDTGSGNEFSSDLTEAERVSGEYQYASTTTASGGDILDYILVSKLPHITSEATFLTKYTFADTIAEGLTYNADVKIAFYDNASDAYINNTANAVEVWNESSASFTADADNDAHTLTVAMTEAGLAAINGDNTNDGSSYSGCYIVVYYTVTVNSDASVVLGDAGNQNDVTLTWSRTSTVDADGNPYEDTLEDRCYVYVYGIQLTKTFSDGKGDATKVQFLVYNETDGYYVTAKEDAAGLYYITGKTTEREEATVFSPDTDGLLLVYGVEGDLYSMEEIHTDNGYSLLSSPLAIEIVTASRSIQAAVAGWTGLTGYNGGQQNGKIAMYVSEVVSGTATVDGVAASLLNNLTTANGTDSANAVVKLEISNTKTFTLPQTGGAGLYLVTVLGVLAVAGGCFFACKKTKKTEGTRTAA